MEVRYRESANQPRALAKDADISLSSVQRVIAGQTGPGVDTIECIANAFDLSLYQLLIPGLDPHRPQEVPGALKQEERYLRRARRGELSANTGLDGTETHPGVVRMNEKPAPRGNGRAPAKVR